MANTRIYISLFKDGEFHIEGIPVGVEIVVIDARKAPSPDFGLEYFVEAGDETIHEHFDVFSFAGNDEKVAAIERQNFAGLDKALNVRQERELEEVRKTDEQNRQRRLKLSGEMVTIPITDDGPKEAPDEKPYWFEALEQAAQTMGNIESLHHIGEFLDLPELQETLTLVLKALERARQEGGNQ